MINFIMAEKKVLLTIMPVFWPKIPPLGLGYLQGYLSQQGIKADLLDLNNRFYNLSDAALKKQWLVSCNVALESRIMDLIKSDFPAKYEDTLRELLEYEYLGFSCFKSNFQPTLDIVKVLKKNKKGLKVILGGPEIARRFFKLKNSFTDGLNRLADFFVAGEGEKPLADFIKGGVKNKVSLFKQLTSLETINYPEYTGLDFNDYARPDAIALQYSRGCIRKCNFCSEKLLYKGFRSRRPDSLIKEIRVHKEKNKINYFVFFDSMINADLGLLEQFCDMVISDFGSINWEAQIAVRPDMPERLLAKIKKSGCYNLFIGLESGCDNTLKRMNKGFSAEAAESFFKKLKKAGLFFGISIIVGYPGETPEDFEESLEFIVKNKNLIPKIEQVNPFTYYDGTNADRSGDYKINKIGLERMRIFVDRIKQEGFKYTNAFLGNLIEKNG